MSVTVIENFVSQEDCETITSFFDTICNPHPSLYGYTTTSGFETSNQASRLSMENPILPISGNLKEDEASLLLTSYVLKLKKEMEKAYDQKISLVNCNYVQMTTGANNGLHSDSTDLDGVQLHDKEELEFSALMYFNNYGVDFTGGQIIFPKENLNIKPKTGTAVFFKGDIDHIHAVQTVKTGSRKNAVMFFSKYQNTSDRMLFNDQHSGVFKVN